MSMPMFMSSSLYMYTYMYMYSFLVTTLVHILLASEANPAAAKGSLRLFAALGVEVPNFGKLRQSYVVPGLCLAT